MVGPGCGDPVRHEAAPVLLCSQPQRRSSCSWHSPSAPGPSAIAPTSRPPTWRSPTLKPGPEDVVRAYVDAYNHRDFAARAELYPFLTVPSWYEQRRAIGTMDDLEIISSAKDVTYGPNSPYWMVVVHLRFTGLQGSDLNLGNGPTGWAYWLERGPDGAWRIADHGNGRSHDNSTYFKGGECSLQRAHLSRRSPTDMQIVEVAVAMCMSSLG